MFDALGGWAGSISLSLATGLFLVLALMETLRPRREHRMRLAHRWSTNIGLQIVNTVVQNLAAPALVALVIERTGLIHWHPAASALPYVGGWPILVFGILALDLYDYGLHRISHAVAPLWRLHAVHHADGELDASTGWRHHPLESLLAVGFGVAFFLLLGLPAWIYPVYGVITIVSSLVQHANVALPRRIDAALRLVFVTPAMHEVHHSADPDDFGRNYSAIFSFWDRLFGTYRPAPARGVEHTRFGVDPFTGPKYATPGWSLLLPFKL